MKSAKVIFLLIPLIFLINNSFVVAAPLEVDSEILSAVQNQIDKEKKFGRRTGRASDSTGAVKARTISSWI